MFGRNKKKTRHARNPHSMKYRGSVPDLETLKEDFLMAFSEEFGRLPEKNRISDQRFFISYIRHRMYRERGRYYDHEQLHPKGMHSGKIHALLERSSAA